MRLVPLYIIHSLEPNPEIIRYGLRGLKRVSYAICVGNAQ